MKKIGLAIVFQRISRIYSAYTSGISPFINAFNRNLKYILKYISNIFEAADFTLHKRCVAVDVCFRQERENGR
jgi:hypothetical protein